MLTLPIPLVFALILLFLLAALRARGPVAAGLVALVAVNAGQGLVIAGGQYYGFAALQALQPVSAMLVPPVAWLALASAGFDRTLRPADALHLIGPAFAFAVILINRDALDVLIPAAYLGYGIALLLRLRQGPLPRASLGSGGRLATLWTAIALGLVLSALSDIAIVGVQIAERADLQPLVVSVTGSLVLLGLGILGIAIQAETGASVAKEASLPAPTEDDAALFARLEDLMRDRRPWRDPDLTLGQLARRLHVPVKSLSVAVNRCSGDNISRYVNGHRVVAACLALRQGVSVTEAMLEAGFATKSNFNREFGRATGKSPSDWQATDAAGTAAKP
jgi:AraC-like DNA-binding protein